MQAQISGWLEQDGWNPVESQSDESEWLLSATDDRETKIAVGQVKGTKDLIKIVATIEFDDDPAKQLRSQSDRDDLIWDLRFDLLRAGLDFSGVDHPLQSIHLVQDIHNDDSFNRDRFLRLVDDVKRGVLIVTWTLERRGLLREE